ncbi:hypothetical protein DNTS_034969 [Danionella cerebrum]|uniref:Uncharacterized protein n=1 Tax=Danionella cerebrum TaxID=2873325 RepID=A0A553MT68_9TELE|nr:hypothetical protein DNTS_034969 [Danionella translucida]
MRSKRQRKKRWKKSMSSSKKHTIKPEAPVQEEDWEKELEEISQNTHQSPYDPGDDFLMGLQERTLENGPSSGKGHYSPSDHHIRPVKWVRTVYVTVQDQFADAEDCQ